jgi:hypothetical protein
MRSPGAVWKPATESTASVVGPSMIEAWRGAVSMPAVAGSGGASGGSAPGGSGSDGSAGLPSV